jgi:hypothetical protein
VLHLIKVIRDPIDLAGRLFNYLGSVVGGLGRLVRGFERFIGGGFGPCRRELCPGCGGFRLLGALIVARGRASRQHYRAKQRRRIPP